ncbi:MAG: hypothetical protein IPG24_06690 [Leptospiraceae bacterium]|nr:hypothetical protein [Leptospiraceae bacterium]
MGWNKLIVNARKKSTLLNEVQNGVVYVAFISFLSSCWRDQSFVTANSNYAEENFPVIVEKENIFGNSVPSRKI